jgi:hypothetical protein
MAESLITYRVNDGQQIPHFDGKERRILTGGDTIEGPLDWKREFSGRMTALDGGDASEDPRMATAQPHEQVTYLQEQRAKLDEQAAALDKQIADKIAESEKIAADKSTTAKAQASGTDASVLVRNASETATPSAVEDVEHR